MYFIAICLRLCECLTNGGGEQKVELSIHCLYGIGLENLIQSCGMHMWGGKWVAGVGPSVPSWTGDQNCHSRQSYHLFGGQALSAVQQYPVPRHGPDEDLYLDCLCWTGAKVFVSQRVNGDSSFQEGYWCTVDLQITVHSIHRDYLITCNILLCYDRKNTYERNITFEWGDLLFAIFSFISIFIFPHLILRRVFELIHEIDVFYSMTRSCNFTIRMERANMCIFDNCFYNVIENLYNTLSRISSGNSHCVSDLYLLTKQITHLTE